MNIDLPFDIFNVNDEDINMIKKEINLARINKTGYILNPEKILVHNSLSSLLLNNIPQWNQFIEHINYCYKNKRLRDPEPNKDSNDKYGEIFKNSLVFYKNKHHYISAAIYPESDIDNFFPQIQIVSEFFKKILDDPDGVFNQSFINFLPNEDQIEMHIDKRETLFWLCQGSVTWVLADPDDWEKTTEYNLKAGDVMFAPYGMPHTVKTHSSRAGIVFQAHLN